MHGTNNRRAWAIAALALGMAATTLGPERAGATSIRSGATGQALGQTSLTLDAIFADGAYRGERFGPARWLDDAHYATIEPSGTVRGARDLVRYEAASGAREIVVGAHELTPDFADAPVDIEDYALSPDNRLVLLFSNSARVWRANTRGDYWIFDLRSRELTRLGNTRRESALMFAKFSPDATRVAYVMDNDLYQHDLRTGVVTRLTHDGSSTIINGTFDWVYEEELFLRDGYRWSPDGRHIAFWQLDASLVRDFVLVNNTDDLYPRLSRFPYPKAGEVNSAARIGIIPAGGGATVWAEFQGSPRDFYLARMDWADSSGELIVQRLNRRQNVNRVYLVDSRTGRPHEALTDTDEAWVEIRDDLHWVAGGAAFTWVSERDGWRRAYRIERRTGAATPISPAGVDLLDLVHVDETTGWFYYTAAPGDPTRRYLYRAPLDPGPVIETDDAGTALPMGTAGPGKRFLVATRVTPADQSGTHAYEISPGGSWAIHTYSTFTAPPRSQLVSLPDHRPARALAENRELRAKVAGLGIDHEFFRVSVAPGVELDAWVMLPPGFDRSSVYPVVFYVYGEPWGQTVLDRWGGARTLWHQLLAERGYVVMSVDNRGTPAPRGRQWRKIVYGEVGTLAAQDQADAVRAILAGRAWLDPERVGIWGWSGGGSMTLNAMFRHPDVYATGMSVAPVPDQRYYDTIYQERYMGTPQDNPDGYRRGSPITYADRLTGNLLIVHGTGDDNVHYQGTEALINELIEHGKHFTMMAYPNRSHGIFEGPGTTRHLYGLLTRYLEDNLPTGPR